MRRGAGHRQHVPSMRSLVFFVAAVVALVPTSQTYGATTGTIRGKVVNASTNEAQPGARVVLTGGTESGVTMERVARSDRRGRYRFEGLPTGDDRFYTVDARYDRGLFAGRALSLPSDTDEPPVIDTTIRVWPTTTDPTAIIIRRDDLFVIIGDRPGGGGVGVIESVTVVNRTDLAYIGRGANGSGEDAPGASLGFALPDGAEGIRIVDSDLDIPELVPSASGFAATVAIPPGQTSTTFSYEVPGSGGSFDLSRPALYPTLELAVFAAPPLEIESNRLHQTEGVTLSGTRYTKWETSDALDAGDPLQALAIARSQLPVAPMVAVGVGVLVLATLAAALAALRRTRVRADAPVPAGIESDGDLVSAIAELDLRRDEGRLDETEWAAQRDRLKARLRRRRATEEQR